MGGKMNRFIEYLIITFVFFSIVIGMELSSRVIRKNNFMTICEAKGNTIEFCKAAWDKK